MTQKIDKNQLVKSASEAESLLKCAANRNRLMILCALLEGDKCVGELNQEIPLSQSALSQHLSILREAGLVATQRDAQTIHYSIADQRIRPLLETLYTMFCGTETLE